LGKGKFKCQGTKKLKPTYEDKDFDANFTNEREWGILQQRTQRPQRRQGLETRIQTRHEFHELTRMGDDFAGGKGWNDQYQELTEMTRYY
jgi:hypothetical protein